MHWAFKEKKGRKKKRHWISFVAIYPSSPTWSCFESPLIFMTKRDSFLISILFGLSVHFTAFPNNRNVICNGTSEGNEGSWLSSGKQLCIHLKKAGVILHLQEKDKQSLGQHHEPRGSLTCHGCQWLDRQKSWRQGWGWEFYMRQKGSMGECGEKHHAGMRKAGKRSQHKKE